MSQPTKQKRLPVKIEASPECGVTLGICKICNARFLGVTRASVVARLNNHRVVVHPGHLIVQ